MAPDLNGFTPEQAARILRAAAAFRKAAAGCNRGPGSWFAPWGEMAELCAAVDGVPGPDDEPAELTTVGPVLSGFERKGERRPVHAAVAYPRAVYVSACTGVELDEREVGYARRVVPTERCTRPACAAAYAKADQEIPRRPR